jgi:hypothetical protein
VELIIVLVNYFLREELFLLPSIFYSLVENQFYPKLSSEIRIKGKSNTNSLRPEACPAKYRASSN